MKHNSIKRELNKTLFTVLFAMILISGSCFSQRSYEKAKVVTNAGHVFYGKNVRVGNESISLRSNGHLETYNFSELDNVAVKKGRARRWGMGMGSVSFGVVALVLFDDPQANINNSNSLFFPYLGATVLVSTLAAGFGFLLGTVADPWQEVYRRSHSSAFNQLQPVLNIDWKGRPMIGLAYSF